MATNTARVGWGHNWGLEGAVVAIASFDGLLPGHQALIAEAGRIARQRRAPLVAIDLVTIDPPGASEHTASRLMNDAQEAGLYSALGVNRVHALASTVEAARDDTDRFALKVAAFASHIVIDECLGALRRALQRAAGIHGVSLSALGGDANIGDADAVRAALVAGQPERAASLLGRPFTIEGVVVEGQKLGRQLGFPTANVGAGRYVRPKLGVYATRSRLADGREAAGVANFGVNPTTGLVEARLEVFLFDFDDDIYGQTLATDLIAFIRPELKFDSLAEMVARIKQDVEDARAILTPPDQRRRAAFG